ncbi:FAD/NAD(P)-binding domain-containing protein [Cryphonectria parasitica EP155]|uniref:FAD/NAD(P)-binding domain-containing protein n=1 Tax=Cryphonectria parasitica (strain ATCC 38755 / EP155) TaxID=660469 RepID=A0A9P4XXU3_CRYP1|nr:FAD/NAD(P)-binding domain-containing protein [Cryphonectria parasitica EP155]KAF3762893.1 FAD/NAD(P)-binding domain-containing protein [Cryphonectria parasitica EP155]
MGEPPSSNGSTTTEEKKFKTSLTDYSTRHGEKTGPYADNLDIDAIIVGGGFSGTFMLKTLRDRGFKAAIFEAGNDLGGTWRFNCYPGARVDSAVPTYEFSWPEVYESWTWTTNYPDYKELRAYFDHVDNVLDIKKDCSFHTVVTGANFDKGAGKWIVETADGRTSKCRFLILGSGFAAKRYIPDWPGIEKFQGVLHHSSFWPDEEVDVKGKRCAVIGTGASGVQISQEWAPVAGRLTVFQRTPNLALPMGRKPLTAEEQNACKQLYHQLFEMREKSFSGFLFDFAEKQTFDDTPEEREAFYQKLWDTAGFHYWLANYDDMLKNGEANTEAYNFWAKKVRERITDPKKRDILAPLKMPHYFGIKRPCLEHSYYEALDRETVEVVDVSKNAIKAFDETGIILEDGTHYDVDAIAIATGFDIMTGGMTQMGLNSVRSTQLAAEWQAAANTYLGITVSGYPNMFHMYGPHGPTLLSNGPATVEVQGRWIADAITKMQRQGIKYIDATQEATKTWKARINYLSDQTLFPTTRSTYMGGSVPGKAFEQVNYSGGLSKYKDEIREALNTCMVLSWYRLRREYD